MLARRAAEITTTMRFLVGAETAAASSAFDRFARSVEAAAGAANRTTEALALQSRAADASVRATEVLARSDAVLRDANLELAVATGKLTRSTVDSYIAFKEQQNQLGKTARAADEAAVQLELAGKATESAGKSAGGAGFSFSQLGQIAMPALIGAGVALSPVIATVGLGLGGLALAALQASKNTAEMSKILGPLKSQFQQFSLSLQPEVLKLFGDGARTAGHLLGDLQPVAAATGKALDGVLGSIDKEFRSQTWQDFFGFMSKTAGPDVQQLGQLFKALLDLLPPLVTQLQPLASGLLTVATDTVQLVTALTELGDAASGAGQSVSDLQATFQQEHSGGFLDKLIGWIKGTNQVKSIIDQTATSAGTMGTIAAAGAQKAADATSSLLEAAVKAAPQVGTLAGDVALLDTATTSATTDLQAFSDLWNIFVGNAVSDQQAVLNVAQAFDSYDKTLGNSKKTSAQVQLAFLSIFTAIGTGLDTLHKNGASIQELNGFYATNIARLQALHGLTPQQRQDIQGLVKDYDAWASSAQGLHKNVLALAGGIQSNLISSLKGLHHDTPQVNADIANLANAILKTGTQSQATASDRAKLIKDLENAGLKAKDAKTLVGNLQTQIDALHGKNVALKLVMSGTGVMEITGTGITTRSINLSTGQVNTIGGHTAKGWLVSGGTPGKDSVPIMAMPGELVVPTAMVRAGLVDHLRGRGIPGFAAGGIVGSFAGAEGTAATADAQWGQLAGVAFAAAALQAAQKAAAAAAGFLGPGSGSYAADIATVLRAMGLPLSLVGNWLAQIQTESGGNLRAVNLTDSNAAAGHPSVGLLQLIPSTFHAYAGPYVNTPPLVNFGGGTVSENPMAQIYAAIHYAAARYGGAAMASVIGHGHGYDAGGYLPPGLTLAYNGTGRPERVLPPGRGGGDTYVTNHVTVQVPATAHPAQVGKEVARVLKEYERVNGPGWRS